MASSSIDPYLNRLIKNKFPAENTAGSFFSLPGLSGNSSKVVLEHTTLLARYQHPERTVPGVDRRREYNILRALGLSGLAPRVFGYSHRWLLLSWLPGKTLSSADFIQQLRPITECMAFLHRQTLSGYRVEMLRLLERYWQIIHPQRRHCGWLRALQRLKKQGEPKPLRYGLLHMDIHAGNLVYGADGIKLIDWEYAGDGDVALELASVVMSNALSGQQEQAFIRHYAGLQNLEVTALHQQMRRWQPWLNLLVACWYELRLQQSGDTVFKQLAAESWQRVLSE